MRDAADYVYDAATALTQGRRDRQEDAVTTHFPAGAGLGLIVLADGMGGHAAGDVASAVVVEEVAGNLGHLFDDPRRLEGQIGDALHAALARANDRMARLSGNRPELRGMGSTVVATVVIANRLYWISVGDSPLYLMRGNRMARLNQEHSMASRMAGWVAAGRLSPEEAERHPDLGCLTSVLRGTPIPEIDCRDCPLDLQDGDIVIAASDGLGFLHEDRIAAVVFALRDRPSADIAAKLLQEIAGEDDPEQDNVSLGVLKLRKARVEAPRAVARARAMTRTVVHLGARRNGQRLGCTLSSVREGGP